MQMFILKHIEETLEQNRNWTIQEDWSEVVYVTKHVDKWGGWLVTYNIMLQFKHAFNLHSKHKQKPVSRRGFQFLLSFTSLNWLALSTHVWMYNKECVLPKWHEMKARTVMKQKQTDVYSQPNNIRIHTRTIQARAWQE